MRSVPLYQVIAQTFQAYQTCASEKEGKPHLAEWEDRHRDRLESLVREHMPHGSGIDSGTTFDFDRSTADKLVFHTSYHHMNEGGMYDGWTEHTVTVRPSLAHGLTMVVGGRDRNQIKDYLHDVFHTALVETKESW